MSKRSLRDRSDDEEEEVKRPVQLTDEQKRFVNIGQPTFATLYVARCLHGLGATKPVAVRCCTHTCRLHRCQVL